MSRVLPKELRSKRVDSLPEDLKSIAEELIATKFGVEEEVVERNARNPYGDGYGCNDAFYESRSSDSWGYHGGPEFDPRLMHPPARQFSTSSVSLDSCSELLVRFKHDTEGYARESRAIWNMGRKQLYELLMDERSRRVITLGEPQRLFRLPVLVSGYDTYGITLQAS